VATETTKKKPTRDNIGQEKPSGGSDGGRDPRFPFNDGKHDVHIITPEQYRIGMMVGIAAIMMMFVGLVSAYIVRAVSPNKDWTPLEMPRILWVSTAILFISSVTFELARRYLLNGRVQDYSRWLIVTAWLGFGFIAMQLWAWQQLRAQGIYLSSNPHSAFFYILTALHGVHLLGGLIALGYLVIRALKEKAMDAELRARRIGAVEAARLYWHFLDVLWVALFALLFFWR
jgi:cytochrome c oxidase subunit 3